MSFELLTIGAIALFAFTLSGVFGFGSGLLLTPILMFLLPIKTAIAVVTFAYFVSTLFKTILYRKSIDWKVAFFVGLSAAPAVYVGSSLMVSAPTQWLKRLLALIILLYVLKEILNWNWQLHGKIKVFTGSVLYGLITGLIGTASPIKAMVFNDLKITKEGFIGAMAATALLMNIIKLANWTRYSLISSKEIPLCIVLSFTAIIGAIIGKKLVNKIDVKQFHKGLLFLLFTSAVALLV